MRYGIKFLEGLFLVSLDALLKYLAGLRNVSVAAMIQFDLGELIQFRLMAPRVSEIVGCLEKESVIFQDTLQGFKIEARHQAYPGALEIRTASGTKQAFSEAFRKYDNPCDHLRELMQNDGLRRADLSKLFERTIRAANHSTMSGCTKPRAIRHSSHGGVSVKLCVIISRNSFSLSEFRCDVG
jgi:hypothetical protein